MNSSLSEDSLIYHALQPAGKLSTIVTKPTSTQKHLSMAYSPGVAAVCKAIEKNPDDIYKYTWKGNTVAVVSEGSAVLGLGNIGAKASYPVMEGKGLLFKRFADIDGIPIILEDVQDDEGKTSIAKVVETVSRFGGSFGGINLEDIAAPQCFDIELQLKAKMDVPVFHDDQHGTSIVVLAGLLNSLTLASKSLVDAKIIINGAGAAGLNIAHFLKQAGATNITVCDSRGVIYVGRTERINPYKLEVAIETADRTLNDALIKADVFIGVSKGNILTAEMIKGMNEKSIIFALANPTPEIDPSLAKEAGAFIISTGRSDFPNQVNNVLGFPGIFRGALDTRASEITECMKLAASEAIRSIAEQSFPTEIQEALKAGFPKANALGLFELSNPLSTDYIIPKPTDPRVVPRVARKVAEAAMAAGVARTSITDLDVYEAKVARRIR